MYRTFNFFFPFSVFENNAAAPLINITWKSTHQRRCIIRCITMSSFTLRLILLLKGKVVSLTVLRSSTIIARYDTHWRLTNVLGPKQCACVPKLCGIIVMLCLIPVNTLFLSSNSPALFRSITINYCRGQLQANRDARNT